MNKEVNVFKYVIIFSTIYLLSAIILNVILDFLEFSKISIAIVPLLGAAFFTIITFLHNHKRLPTKSEEAKLVSFSIIASLLIKIVLSIAFLFSISEQFSLQSGMIPLLTLLIAFEITLDAGCLSFIYGFIAETRFDSLKKRGLI
ncbi:MAG: hypothetical protein GY714_01205 [Desulfobacterales bacterium]|nr:hypothetical protein [Desulfobacterales bacterium]MCP4161358.1 hypothetical protein [Deltaproteobacteria bacterium]